MTKLLLFTLFFISAVAVFAQEPTIALKVYSNFYLGDRGRGEPNLYLERFDDSKYKGTTIAWFSSNPDKKFTKEIELGMRLRTRKVPFDSTVFKIKDIEAAVRFELGARLKSRLFDRVSFSFNTAFDLFYYQGEAVPEASSAFRRRSHNGGILLSFIPHIEIPITNRLFVDLNINFINVSFGMDFIRVDNPAWTATEQKSTSFDFDTQGERSFRIGLGYYIN